MPIAASGVTMTGRFHGIEREAADGICEWR